MTTLSKPPQCIISEEDKILFDELLNYFDLFSIVLKTDKRFTKYFKQFGSVFPLISSEIKLQYIYFSRQIFHKSYISDFTAFKNNRETFALALFKTALYFENPVTRSILGGLIYELSLAFFGASSDTFYIKSNLLFEKLINPLALYDYSSFYGYCNKVSSLFSHDFNFLSQCLTLILGYVKDYMEYDLKHIALTVIIQEYLKAKEVPISKANFEESLTYVTNLVYPNTEEVVVKSVLYFAEDFLAADFLFNEVTTTDTTDDNLSSFFMSSPTQFELDNDLIDDIFGRDSSATTQGGNLFEAI
ncbi:MAG: hypothetical protein IM488_18320 [Microcystis sp. M025S2]|uniref:hypothetical protein n=1 Tax=Microcystis sp. M025S2 TaxID=2771161 RepID=UPI002586989D|nr:hypothetical protein [Microcystis sp. M025S2]MCA2711284.1 hypothetical protein [Microcystis sp. M025S2]